MTAECDKRDAYSCKDFRTPSSSLSRSSLFLRGLIALASSGGYSGLSVWYVSLPFGIIIEDDLCLSAIFGRSIRLFLTPDRVGAAMMFGSASDPEDVDDDALDNGGES